MYYKSRLLTDKNWSSFKVVWIDNGDFIEKYFDNLDDAETFQKNLKKDI